MVDLGEKERREGGSIHLFVNGVQFGSGFESSNALQRPKGDTSSLMRRGPLASDAFHAMKPSTLRRKKQTVKSVCSLKPLPVQMHVDSK
jgi:hypothetical protein